jgi:hypothetical protein
MGQAGRKKVEQEYSLQVTGPKLAGLIKSNIMQIRGEGAAPTGAVAQPRGHRE